MNGTTYHRHNDRRAMPVNGDRANGNGHSSQNKEITMERDVAPHNGGRIGCNHSGGICSELSTYDVGHDLYGECSRPGCECHRLIRD